jgi:hypothetical protein
VRQYGEQLRPRRRQDQTGRRRISLQRCPGLTRGHDLRRSGEAATHAKPPDGRALHDGVRPAVSPAVMFAAREVRKRGADQEHHDQRRHDERGDFSSKTQATSAASRSSRRAPGSIPTSSGRRQEPLATRTSSTSMFLAASAAASRRRRTSS